MSDYSDESVRTYWTETLNDFHQYTMTGFRLAQVEVNGRLNNYMVLHANHNATEQPVRFIIQIADGFVPTLDHSFSRLQEEISK